MKLRILSLGFAAAHQSITVLPNLDDPRSISDFDAFVFDPNAVQGTQISHATALRRRKELAELINKKGGIIVCILRPSHQVSVAGHAGAPKHNYHLLESVSEQIVKLITNASELGQGTAATRIRSAHGACEEYLRILKDEIVFAAYLDTPDSTISTLNGTIFARNSVGYPIAVEFPCGDGRVCFVPTPHSVSGERVGSAIASAVSSHFKGPTEIDAPAWATELTVPGASIHDDRIQEAEKGRAQLAAEISALEDQRTDLLNFKRLLFGYGKAVLEPSVRAAFRLIGFEVLEPEDYQGEWDVQMSEPHAERTAVGEVEGSEGQINVDKYRQLNDYVDTEALEGRLHKGILIGNGYKSLDPGSSERKDQFTEHVLRGATRNGFCLVPSTELFKVVCAVLSDPQNEALKLKIRESILESVGPWTFNL